MQLKWSHAVLNVKDVDKELAFYTGVPEFTISDRGPVGKNAPEIVFMSQDKSEHHQLALMVMREDEGPSNSLNHLAFRVESFDDIKQLSGKLDAAGVDILPLSHGNTLSLYFSDPERNGLEVFWDTPWHIAQPNGTLWDTSLNETEALAWVEAEFGDQPSFKQREVADGAFVNRN